MLSEQVGHTDREPPEGPFSELVTQTVGGGRWMLKQDFGYARPNGEVILAPRGFAFDFDSVPRLPLIYWRLKNRTLKAAAAHDWMYHSGRTQPRPDGRGVTRREADAIFLEAMRDEGVGPIHRALIHFGVRIGGWRGWNRYRRRGNHA